MPLQRWRAARRAVGLVFVLAFVSFALAPPAIASPMSPPLIGLTMTQMAIPVPDSPAPSVPGAAQALPAVARPAARPRGLLPLFVSYATLQALDVHSTLIALHNGAVEQNPIVGPFVNRPAALVAFKAATTAGAILAADRLARHNRPAAYALMFALNSAYAFVVVHNYKVAGR